MCCPSHQRALAVCVRCACCAKAVSVSYTHVIDALRRDGRSASKIMGICQSPTASAAATYILLEMSIRQMTHLIGRDGISSCRV